MLKILQIGMTDNLGGIESFIMNYYRNINKNKIQFDFINIYDGDLCFQKEIEKLGGNVYQVTSYYKNPIKYLKEVIKIIKRNQYDVVHCNMNSSVFLYPLIAAKIAKAKVIISHAHNASSDKGVIKNVIHSINKHFIPMFADKYFACSYKAACWFYSNKIIKSKNFFIINNAIDIRKFVYNELIRKEVRKKLKISDNTLLIGHVGRFVVQKNHKFIIEIFMELISKEKNCKLLLIGTGPLKEMIKEIVENNNLFNKVIFLENRNDINELMQAMDIFVLPSLYEGLPLVGVEAQYAGLPCVFSDSITKEVKLNDSTIFIPLKFSVKYWVKKIIELKKHKRGMICDNSFDIFYNSKKLEDLYISFIEK